MQTGKRTKILQKKEKVTRQWMLFFFATLWQTPALSTCTAVRALGFAADSSSDDVADAADAAEEDGINDRESAPIWFDEVQMLVDHVHATSQRLLFLRNGDSLHRAKR